MSTAGIVILAVFVLAAAIALCALAIVDIRRSRRAQRAVDRYFAKREKRP